MNQYIENFSIFHFYTETEKEKQTSSKILPKKRNQISGSSKKLKICFQGYNSNQLKVLLCLSLTSSDKFFIGCFSIFVFSKKTLSTTDTKQQIQVFRKVGFIMCCLVPKMLTVNKIQAFDCHPWSIQSPLLVGSYQICKFLFMFKESNVPNM